MSYELLLFNGKIHTINTYQEAEYSREEIIHRIQEFENVLGEFLNL